MSEELKFAIELAKEAGEILMNGFDRVRVEKTKADKRDILTNMDLEAEKIIIEKIKQKYPSHQIDGEEYGRIKGDSDYLWILDALCGTKYYAKGIKLFNVSIALWKGDEPIIGVIYLLTIGDLYWAEKDKGAFCNNKRIRVSDIDNLKEAIIYLDMASSDKLRVEEHKLFSKRLELISKHAYRFRALGLGGFACCFIAQGGYEAYFDLSGKEEVLDVAAGIVIAKEAGATITGLDGKFHGQNVSHLIITNGKIHNEFLKLLNSK